MIRLLLFLVTISGFCQAAKESPADCEIITIALNSGQFAPWYAAEAKGGKPVILYDGANGGKPAAMGCDSITLAGKGIVIVRPLDFKVDINGVKQKIINPRIILHKLEKTKDGYTIAFLYSELNQALTLYYNRKGELLDYSNGAF